MILDRVSITSLSAPLDEPVLMSFSQLTTREMILVEVECDGLLGIGESWVNYPAWAAVERVATLERGVVPLLAGLDVSDPTEVHAHLRLRLAGIARQWGAPGPVWQAISAIDMALWDLLARSRGVPLWSLLGEAAGRERVTAYASGIGPSAVAEWAGLAARRGFTAVKTRVGFGRERDAATLGEVRAVLGDDVAVFADANQAWDLAEAEAFCAWSSGHGVGWLEEPLAGNRLGELAELAGRVEVPLACGENVYGAEDLVRYATAGALGVIQPDLAKCGGFTAALALVERLPDAVVLAPHCYGGAVVSAASVQLAAARAAPTLLEMDVRPNPLRDDLLVEPLRLEEGAVVVPSGPGLGIELDRAVLEHHVVDRRECDLRAVV